MYNNLGPQMNRNAVFVAVTSCVILAGCTPPWSLRMQSFSTSTAALPHIVDSRTQESKTFRFVDFGKVSYRTYLGDSNTTPTRLQALAVRAAAAGLTPSDTIDVARFDILNDTSGSACKTCATAAVSYSGAVAAEGDRVPGDNRLSCDLEAKLNGKSFHAHASAPYRTGAFDGPASEPFARAADACVGHAIDAWLGRVRGS